MKALIISDLHSNIDALEAIWEKEKDSDIIYCAGDLVDVGPNPNEVVQWLKEHAVKCVAGNHDQLLLDSITVNNKNENLTWLELNAKFINKESIEFLKSLPNSLQFQIDGHFYYMTHQYKEDYALIQSKFEYSQFLKSRNINEPVRLILGHTHKQLLVHFSNNQMMLNPGSTAYRSYLEPENLCTKPEYIVIQNGVIILKSIDYDKRRVHAFISSLKRQLKSTDFEKMLKRVTID